MDKINTIFYSINKFLFSTPKKNQTNDNENLSSKTTDDTKSSLSNSPTSPTEKNNPSLIPSSTVLKHQLPCFALNLYEKYGALQTKKIKNNFYIFKFEKILIEDHFKLLFNKGQINNDDSITVKPELKSFWCQRYYYYSKFDDGIKMDDESK